MRHLESTKRDLWFIVALLVVLAMTVFVSPIDAAEPPAAVDLKSAPEEASHGEPLGEPSVTPSALPEGDCDGGEIYDDGVAENGYSGNPAVVDKFQGLMLFTPSSYPAKYETICLALTTIVGGGTYDFTIQVFDDDGPGGEPGTLLAETDVLTVDVPTFPPCKFYEVDIDDLDAVISNGSIYVGVQWEPVSPDRFFCTDESPATPLQPGFINFNTGDGWQATESVFPNYRAHLVRAVRDLTPPETTITSGPADGSTIPVKTATFEFEANETSTFECRLDGLPFGNCTGPGDSHTIGGLSEGAHTFEVRAVDIGGNTDPTPASRAFTVDAVPDPSTTTTTTTVPDHDFFIDDNGSIFEDDINAIAAEGITFGCNPPTNNMFCPNDSFLRGQAAAFLRRALSVPPSPNDFFIDDDDSVFEQDINAVAEAGITFGCNPPDNDRYCPDDSFLRGQAAAFLRRALSVPVSSTNFFVDDDTSVFEDDINAVAEAGITFGCNPPNNNRYCPDDSFVRGQAAAFLRRALLP